MTTETDIKIATAPLTGEERELLPEGIRDRNVRTFWTVSDLRTAVEADTGNAGTEGDIVRYAGEDFLIVEIEDWGGFVEARGVAQ